MIGRRRLLTAGLAGLAAMPLLAACGGAASAPTAAPKGESKPAPAATTVPAGGATTAAPAATKPAAGAATPSAQTTAKPAAPAAGRVTIVMGQQPDTLMPRIGSMMARTEVLGALQTRAVVTDDHGKFVPMGVEQVPSFENGGAKWVGDGDDKHLEVTFKVKKGLKWHDGNPVTSKDVKFAWSLLMNPKFAVDDRSQEVKVNAVDAVDDQTVLFKYHSAKQAREVAQKGHMGLPADDFKDWKEQKDPVGDPLYMLVGDWAFFLPEHILGKVDPAAIESHEFTRKPVLSGPYKFKEWVPDQSITLEAVPDHVLGAPKIPNVVFRIIKDTNAQLAALQAGEIDVVTQVQGIDVDKAPDLDRIAAGGQFKVHYVPGSPWEHIDLNLDNEHLKDKNVRKAIAYGVNREQIVERVLAGKTKVAHSWVQPGLPPWAWDESCLVKYGFDAGKAKELLQTAGYAPGPDGILAKGGKKLQLKLSTTDQTLRKNTAQVIQAQLKQIGIGLELEFLPGRGLFENKGPLRTRSFDMGMYTWLSQLDPDRMDYMHSKNIPSEKNNFAGNNYPGYKNPRVDELSTKGAILIDEKERKPIYCELQQIWTEELPVLPLFQRVVVAVQRARLQNFKPTPSSTPETWNIHEWALT
ncbi:MAG TPA: peptide ABC transporter substrate-binding protein [Chloroflexota bacterium]